VDIRRTKDFLVEQTVKQAALEEVPMSDLEKRIMYFTEGEDATEDPINLNDEFEANYDNEKYEAKVSGLLKRAYHCLKVEKPALGQQWGEAIDVLRRDDHYLLVLWDGLP
jgi:hypothetical protein